MANLQVGVAGNGTVTVGAGASVHSPASNTLTLGSNNAERFRITGVGSVGIGTDDPVLKLHLHTSDSGNNYLKFTNATTGTLETDGVHLGLGSDEAFNINQRESNDIRLFTAATERLRINSSGNVLIADTSDSLYNDTSGGGMNLKANGQLVLAKQASSAADPLIWLNDTGQTTNKEIVFAQDGSEKANIGLAGNDFTFATGAVERLRVRADGRVSIASSLAVVGVTTAAAFIPSSGQLSNRNKIINGAMQVSQRNGTSAVQLSASEQYFIDRWENDTGSSFDMKCDASQSTEAPEGFSKSMKFDCDGVSAVSGGHNGLITTFLEGQDCQDFKFGSSAAEDLTLSFYAKSGSQNNGHVYGVFLGAYLSGTRNAQTKGFTVTSSWQRFTMTFAGTGTVTSTGINDGTSKGLQIAFSLACGPDDDENFSTWTANSNLLGFSSQDNFFDNTSNELYITGVQLEVGSAATPFEHRSYGDELLRCQRYYQVDRSSNVNSMYESATTYNGKWYQKDHTIEMRAKPTVSTTNGTNSISNSGWTGSTPTAYSSNTHTVYYSSGNAFHLAGTSDGNIGATYESEL